MRLNVLFALLTLGIIFNLAANPVSNTIELKGLEVVADDYVKIKPSELTPPVIEEILKEYPTSKLGAAYKNDNGDFKLIMVLKSGTRRTVYIDKYGNWMNKK